MVSLERDLQLGRAALPEANAAQNVYLGSAPAPSSELVGGGMPRPPKE
jgi:hypothetical protein